MTLSVCILFRIWRARRIVWTKDELYMVRHCGLQILDSIPLHEIEGIMEMNNDDVEIQSSKSPSSTPPTIIQSKLAGNQDFPLPVNNDDRNYDRSSSLSSTTAKKFVVQAQLSNIIQLKTAVDGYNSGKTYYISTRENPNPEQSRQSILAQLNADVMVARRKADAKSRFQKSQEQVLAVQGSIAFQLAMALLITVVTAPQRPARACPARHPSRQPALLISHQRQAFWHSARHPRS